MNNFPYSGLIHVRDFDSASLGVSTNGGMTFVYDIINKDEDDPSIMVSWAICHKADNFNRRIGRSIATGRMFSTYGGAVSSDCTAEFKFSEIFYGEEISHLKQAIRLTEDGVNYVRESEFGLLGRLLDDVFGFIVSEQYGESMEILRFDNGCFVALPVEELEF